MNRLSNFIKKNTKSVCLVLCLILFISVILCIGIGPVQIDFKTVWTAIFKPNKLENISNIVWFLRIPRVFLGVLVGAGLSISGVAMQALTRNPLADPYILGISSGAYFGAVLAIILRVFAVFGIFQVQIGAFCGAMLAICIVYLLSRQFGSTAPMTLVLVGMAVSAMFGAFANFIVYEAPDDTKIRETSFWMLGGIAGGTWKELIPITIIVVISILIMLCLSRPLNALMMGEDTAITLGVNLTLLRRILIIITALLTGSLVAVAGCIGFVGLVVPHFIRAIVGAEHSKVVPLSAITGAIFMIWVDVGARMLDVPKEIPIGILTSMIGAPLFLWLLKAKNYTFGEKS